MFIFNILRSGRHYTERTKANRYCKVFLDIGKYDPLSFEKHSLDLQMLHIQFDMHLHLAELFITLTGVRIPFLRFLALESPKL